MATKNIAGVLARSIRVSAIALAISALTGPSLASAQDRGRPDGDFGHSRGGEIYRGGPRGMSMPQGDGSQQRVQRSRPAPSGTQQAPPVSAGRNYGIGGYRNYGNRINNGEARSQPQSSGSAGERRSWQNRGAWQDGQRNVYRGRAVGTDQRETVERADRAAGRQNWQERQRAVGQYRNSDVTQIRPNVVSSDRRGWRNDRTDWQHNQRGAYGRETWRNDRDDRVGTRRWSSGDKRNWNRDWRNDNRYNWSSYRARNRNVFSSGRYYAPYQNYSYRRLGIGYSLGSGFYGSRYWINDPFYYRLPEAYGPYRWVRYYDDVLLVDTYSGEVVDAIYEFFW